MCVWYDAQQMRCAIKLFAIAPPPAGEKAQYQGYRMKEALSITYNQLYAL